MRRRPGALFAPGLSLWIFSRDILFRLYRKVSYPSFTPHQAQGTYAIRQESEKRAGEYRENGAREDRDPLQCGPAGVARSRVRDWPHLKYSVITFFLLWASIGPSRKKV